MSLLPESLDGRPWLAVALAFGVAIAGFVLVIPVAALLTVPIRLANITLSSVMIVVVSLVALQGIAFPLAAFGYLRARGKSFDYVKARLPTRSDAAWGLGGYVVAFLLAITLLVLVQLVDAPTATRTDGEMLQQPEVLLALIPLSFLLIGPGEELLFRGVIQTTIREAFSAPAAIALASAAFAPAHIVSLVGGPAALFVSISLLFVPSLVFGYVYERTGNLLVPAFAHGAYNATLFGLVYLALTIAPESAQSGLIGVPL